MRANQPGRVAAAAVLGLAAVLAVPASASGSGSGSGSGSDSADGDGDGDGDEMTPHQQILAGSGAFVLVLLAAFCVVSRRRRWDGSEPLSEGWQSGIFGCFNDFRIGECQRVLC